jgi:hypothetical protein
MSLNRSARRQGRDSQIIPHPPQLPSYGITRDVRMRFLTNAAGVTSITYENILDTVLIATGATTAVDLFQAVRVNQVEVWATPVTGAPVTAIVTFDGSSVGAFGDFKVHSDTSMGIEPAHVRARPEPLSQAAQFQTGTTDVAFALSLPTGSVVDVSMTLRQPVAGTALAAQNALVGATAGVIYYRGLDGKAAATTVFPVQGVLSVQ